MKQIAFVSALAALGLAGCMADEPVYGPGAAADPEAQARLAERLEGYVARPAQACVQQRDLEGNTPIDEDTILFRGRGDTLYVNELRSRCAGMEPWHAIRARTVGTNLCEGEIIRVFDPATSVSRGSCALGQFIPYVRR